MKMKLKLKWRQHIPDSGGKPKSRKGGKVRTGNNPTTHPHVKHKHSILWWLNRTEKAKKGRER